LVRRAVEVPLIPFHEWSSVRYPSIASLNHARVEKSLMQPSIHQETLRSVVGQYVGTVLQRRARAMEAQQTQEKKSQGKEDST